MDKDESEPFHKDKITTINSLLMATQNDFTEHIENTNIHIMEEERTAWNAKADTRELDFKLAKYLPVTKLL